MNSSLIQVGYRVRCRYPLIWLFCIWSGLALADSPALVLDRLPTPAGANVQMVTSNSVHNGVPLAIATFHSKESIDSVLDFYRNHWAGDKNDQQPGFVESVLPDWRLISTVNDGYNMVVQLNTQTPHTASGFISVMSINGAAKAEEYREFSDLRPLSSHRSVDGVDTSLMRVYAASSSVSQTHQTYRQRLGSRGWQILSDSEADGARVMVLARDQSRLEVSIVPSRDYGALVVAHKVTSR